MHNTAKILSTVSFIVRFETFFKFSYTVIEILHRTIKLTIFIIINYIDLNGKQLIIIHYNFATFWNLYLIYCFQLLIILISMLY